MRVIAALVVAASPACAIDVPSGQPVELQEMLVDTQGEQTWLRFRFVAPEIARDGGALSYADAVPDFLHLCDTLALPYLAAYRLSGDVIVISLADRATAFGVPDPEATQYFEAFRVQDGTCLWEAF